MHSFGCGLRNLSSTPWVTKSLQIPLSMPHPSPLEKTFTCPKPPYSEHILLHFLPFLFLSTYKTLLLDPCLPTPLCVCTHTHTVRGEGLGSSLLGQLGAATLASAHREPGGFSQDPCRHQADHQQTLGYGSPSKETWEGWAWAQASRVRMSGLHC